MNSKKPTKRSSDEDALSPDDLPVTDAERALLDARLADMEAHPEDQRPWPEVKSRLERLVR